MPTTFGKRGLIGAPRMTAPAPPGPPRALRSRMVVIGAVGALTLGLAGAAEWREQRCRTPAPDDPDPRPTWCDDYGGGHNHSGGHGWGFASGGGDIGHASYGGFGAQGSSHGGGS